MYTLTKPLLSLILLLSSALSYGQEVPFPTAEPLYNVMSPWGYTNNGTNWDTSPYLPFIYQGVWFRLMPPNGVTYDASSNTWNFPDSNTKYPLMIFNTGAGEAGSDNNEQLKHGGREHKDAVLSGRFPGYVLFWQTESGYISSASIESLVNKLINDIQVDPNRIYTNGFSRGGLITWQLIRDLPNIFAAGFAMSGTSEHVFNPSSIHIPMRLAQGGKDLNPTPQEAQALVDLYENNGGNLEYFYYENLGHGIWTTCYALPDFYEWFLSKNKNSIHVFYTFTEICPDETVNVKLGLTAGYSGYEWRKDGILIPSATSNEYTATEFGVYDARFRRGSVWTEWSEPVEITLKDATVTPPIAISLNMSKVLPSLDDNTTTSLELPEGYAEYQWKELGSDVILSTSRIFTNVTPGEYIARVTEFGGCSSSFGDSFTVIDANGSPSPDKPSNLRTTNVQKTSVQLMWDQNSNPAVQETGFEIYRSSASEGGYNLIHIADQNQSSYTDINLITNKYYYYKIRAINSTGGSVESNTISVITLSDENVPTSPSNLKISGTTNSSISLKWDASTDDVEVSRYDIYINSQKSYTTTNTNFTIPGLTQYEVYNFYVVAKDLAGNISPQSNHVTGVPVVSGVNYEYYQIDNMSNLPDFSVHTPDKTGLLENFNISVKNRNDNFAFKFTGAIQIPESGNYTFYTRSDDGSKLYIDVFDEANLIVNNDGLHGMQERNGTIYLEAGSHPIYVTMFEKTGGEGLEVGWQGPNISKQIIPDNVLGEDFDFPGVAPGPPADVLATAIDHNKIEISWNDTISNELGFQVFRAQGSMGDFLPVATVSANAENFVDSDLNPATTYYYQIASLGEYGQSPITKAAMNPLGAINSGVGAIDNATGSGYIMYSAENVFTRFSSNKPNSSNSTNLIAIRYNNGTWQYDNNNAYYNFSPEPSDVILAEVSFSDNTIIGLQGESGEVNGITYGFASGDLQFFADRWNGGNNIGEFTITGTYFNNYISVGDSAVTYPLPEVPAQPGNLQAVNVSSTSITLNWNNIENEGSYNIYRSLSNDDGYELLAQNPANDTVYIDENIFAHTTYFYMVSSENAGGESEFSELEIASANSNPVSDLLSNVAMHYSEVRNIEINSIDNDGDQLYINPINLPEFIELIDYGTGEAEIVISPTSANQGPYDSLQINITDDFGGTLELFFDLVINSNHSPQITGSSGITLKESETTSITLTGSDIDANQLTWSVVDLPSFADTTSADDEFTITFTPGLLDAGLYEFDVVLNDDNGGENVSTIAVTVEDFNPNYNVFVNFGATSVASGSWNNFLGNGNSGETSSNLVNDLGENTTIRLTLETAFNGSSDSGGKAPGIYPNEVMKSYIWTSSVPEVIRITGLNQDYLYNFEFLGSRNSNGDRTTVFTINGVSASVDATQNTSNTARLEGLQPDSNGELILTVSLGSGASYGYMNSMIIESRFDDGSAPAIPTNLSASLTSSNQVSLTWNDIAFNETGYKIFRNTEGGEETQIGSVSEDVETFLDTTPFGHTLYTYRIEAFNNNGVNSSISVDITTNNNLPEILSSDLLMVPISVNTDFIIEATDLDGDSLKVTVDQLPTFATFKAVSDELNVGLITFSPTTLDIGVYEILITVTDKDASGIDLSSTVQTLTVEVTDGIRQTVLVNFNEGNNAPAPWNNMDSAPMTGLQWFNLMDATGSATSLSVRLLNNWQGSNINGVVTGNDSGIYPDVVMQTAYWEGTSQTKTLEISGLQSDYTYDINFFGSRDGSGDRTTIYTINGEERSLNASGNFSNTASFIGISGDLGQLTVDINRGPNSTYAYLNAIEIIVYQSNEQPNAPTDLITKVIDQNTIKLDWIDQSNNESGFEIWRVIGEGKVKDFQLIATVGPDTVSFTDINLTSNTSYQYKVRSFLNNIGESEFSNISAATTFEFSVSINLNDINNAPAPWNNIVSYLSSGDSFHNLKDDSNNNRFMSLTMVLAFSDDNSSGMNTGNDSGIVPDEVLEGAYWLDAGLSAMIRISGLSFTHSYNFNFIGSRNGGGNRTTHYSINDQTVSQNASYNISELVQIKDILSDENGEVLITVTADENASFGYLNGIVIQAAALPQHIANARLANFGLANKDENTLNGYRIYPNPFNNNLTIDIPFSSDKVILMEIRDINGYIIHERKIGIVEGENTFNFDLIDIQAGLYFLHIYKASGSFESFKLLKK